MMWGVGGCYYLRWKESFCFLGRRYVGGEGIFRWVRVLGVKVLVFFFYFGLVFR